jgi:hypothetical protein
MFLRCITLAAVGLLACACTVDSNYGGAGFACSADEPCQSGFNCSMGVCVGGAPGPDGTPGDGPDSDASEIVCLPPIALSDEFSGDMLDAQWTNLSDSQTTAVVGGGVLTMTPRADAVPIRYAIVRSAAADMAEKRVFAELPTMVDTATAAIGYLILRFDFDDFYFLRQSQGVLNFGTNTAGAELVVNATNYDPSAHRWWQLRMTGGRIYADVSSDGSSWVNLDSVDTNVIGATLSVELGAGTESAVASPGTMEVDNVNAGSGLCL